MARRMTLHRAGGQLRAARGAATHQPGRRAAAARASCLPGTV